ncbi:YNFM family putative membrane transporter [Luteococcus japonicus]|uniref:YNFM family putative membrane transporter n=1 Tax=Luteococcus japonicus TaxID=33984 RepID=A0A3N1ZUX3_9ACTN|nr:MFS transporter [Luteococcus japonicus]ROR54558.1 YNFM family putative membrane transporter [Luteococcus japonicus]
MNQPTGPAPLAPGDDAYRRTTVALFLAGLVTFAALYCTQPLLPLLGQVFHVSPAETALSVSATTITLGLALLFLGPISDAFGRTNIMLASLFASGLVTLAVAASPSWPVLLVLRAALGICVAGLPAVAVAYLREEISPGAAGRATGLYIGGTALGGMAGRLLSGALADLFGWRWAIAGIGLLALACAVVVHRLLPRSRFFVAQPLSPAELTAKTLRLLRDPVQLALMTLSFCAMGAFVAGFNAMGFRLEAPPYRLGVGLAGTVFLVYAFGSWSSARAGRFAEGHGPAKVALGGLALQLAGICVTAAETLPLVVLGLALTTIGFFAAHGVASGWVAAHAARQGLGTGQAASLYLFAYYLGSSVAGTAAGWAWSGWRWPGVTLLTAALVVAALLVVRLAGRWEEPSQG